MSIFFIPLYTRLDIARQIVHSWCYAMAYTILKYRTFKSINSFVLICKHLRQSTANYSIIITASMLAVDSIIQTEIEGVILQPSITLTSNAQFDAMIGIANFPITKSSNYIILSATKVNTAAEYWRKKTVNISNFARLLIMTNKSQYSFYTN